MCILCVIGLYSCTQKESGPLPYIGHHEVVNGDTIFHKIPSFDLINQDSQAVNNKSLSNNIYVSDFFFTSCPSICPKVKKQMLRIYDRYEKQDLLKLVSHTLDPKRDDVEVLHTYAKNLGVENEKWLFLTGDKDQIYDLNDDYFVAVIEDERAPGGIDHSGKIVLVDKNGHVRAFAEGTDPEDVTDFFQDIDRLIEEYEQK